MWRSFEPQRSARGAPAMAGAPPGRRKARFSDRAADVPIFKTRRVLKICRSARSRPFRQGFHWFLLRRKCLPNRHLRTFDPIRGSASTTKPAEVRFFGPRLASAALVPLRDVDCLSLLSGGLLTIRGAPAAAGACTESRVFCAAGRQEHATSKVLKRRNFNSQSRSLQKMSGCK